MPLPKAEQPVFLIVAGPNGSGKSSSYRDTEIEQSGRTIWIVNPDVLTVRIHDEEGLGLADANRAAVERIESWLEASIDVHKSVGVETVLSTGKYRRLVDKAKSLGFAVWMVYVVLDSPERNIQRVRLRVSKGGHDVPDEKVRSRYTRSLQQFPWFLDKADAAWIYDNSGAEPRRIGEKIGGVIALDANALPAVVEAARSIETE
ncbi:zeta toxin family protein [Allosphingosinicella sp.]|uniref:zeta toxin family protein n=1 Tax=Allosphingosinicella sp. TaxID=2823234 RepID=UPI002EDE5188